MSKKNVRCQICESNTKQFLDLGEHPPCNFLNEHELQQEILYPMVVHFCPVCSLVQLGKPVNQEALFLPHTGYHHIAALSSSFSKHLDVLASKTAKKFNLKPKDLVVEIGANDGALLEAFQKKNVRVLGVDPSDIAEIAANRGLPVLKKFFNEEIASEIVDTCGQARIMTALNVFAHLSSLHSVVRGIEKLLTADGVFVSENGYILDLIRDMQYDFIYQEHLRYYSLHALIYLFNMSGMDVFDVERIPEHGGSIRVFACKKGAYRISNSVTVLLKEEVRFGLNTFDTYMEFSKKVKDHRKSLRKMLEKIRAEGGTIAGLTFPARAETLLTYCGIGPKIISYVTEWSDIKIGKFTPGTHIKVVDQDILFGDKAPDYGLMLSWHIQEELIARFRKNGFKGKFIIPLPTPAIIS